MINLMNKTIDEMLLMLDEHDCHLSGEDGCVCVDIYQIIYPEYEELR